MVRIYLPKFLRSNRILIISICIIIEGAFFGTTFAHLFFQTYRELAPAPFWKAPSTGGSPLSPRSGSAASNSSRPTPFVNPNPHGGQKRASGYVYVPRIYGFKVSERAKSGPRMQWLRLRPESPEELDSVDWRGRWIGTDDDEYDEEEEDEDRQMEDFDPVCVKFLILFQHSFLYSLFLQDVGEGEEDDDEEEEEEEENGAPLAGKGKSIGKQLSSQASFPPTSSPVHSARTSPTTPGAPRTPEDTSVLGKLPGFGRSPGGKVQMVRQWAPRTDWAGTAQV